jgi:hypothetical protein
MSELVSRMGQSWYGPALVWQEHHLAACVSAIWEAGYQDARFLLSDLPAGRQRVRQYARETGGWNPLSVISSDVAGILKGR